MKAAIVREFSESPLEIVELPVPEPDEGEVLVKVDTAGVVFAETLVARGLYQIRPPLPFISGTECAGTVFKLGEGVTEFAIGDHVAAFGFLRDPRKKGQIVGSLAEYQAIPLSNIFKVPRHIPLEQAALFRSNNETARYGLHKGNLKPGETLLVLGAAGGVGYAAVTIGKRLGAKVIASCSSENKRRIALEGGADFAIDTYAEDWRTQVDALTEGRGIDIVFDPVGGDFTERAFRALGWNGRLVVIGFASGEIPRIPTNLAMLKGISLVGVNILYGAEHEPDVILRQRQELMAWFGEGKISVPPIARRYPLEKSQEAYNAVSCDRVEGRIVIKMPSAES